MYQGNEHSIKTNYYGVYQKNVPTKFKVTKSLNLKKKIVNFLFWEKYGLTLPPLAYENLWLQGGGRSMEWASNLD